MERPVSHYPNHLLTVKLSGELYEALQKKVQLTGKTEAELVIQGLTQILDEPSTNQEEYDRFASLEMALEEKLKLYVESLIKERVSSSELSENLQNPHLESGNNISKAMPIPTIRPLQVGDRVLILEPDSPYYMAKLLVIKTSLIRATVDTDTGEHTFLKRDLRFVEAASES